MISSVTAHNLSPTAFLVDKKIYFFKIANELKCFKDVRKSLFSSLNWAFGHCPFRKSGPTCSNQGEWGNLSNYSGEYVDLQKIRRLIFILKIPASQNLVCKSKVHLQSVDDLLLTLPHLVDFF